MTNLSILKENARRKIRGKLGILFVVSLIIGACSAAADLLCLVLPFGQIASFFIIAPAFALSSVRVYLKLFKNEEVKAGDAFYGFEDFWAAFKVQFLTGLFTFLWSLLFIIPGIVKSISYSMSMYILAENPGMSALECIERSKEMMKGRKWDYFCLSLSFIGWLVLGAFTCGVAYIWILPYQKRRKTP